MRNRRMPALAALAAAGMMTLLAACGSSISTAGGNQQEAAQQQQDTTAVEFAQPLPEFGSSTLRQELIDIEATEALGIRSTTFATTQDGQLMWSCPSIGLPVPVTDNLSNPQQVVNQSAYNGSSYYGFALATIGQMDPDGVYKGDSTGTDVLCVNANGQPYVHYAEEFADAVTARAHWSSGQPHVVVDGSVDIPVCTVVSIRVKGKKKLQRVERCTDPQKAPNALQVSSASPAA